MPLTTTSRNDWRLLILDGHESHISTEFKVEYAVNKVFLLPLPPHSTHILQPLDIAVFSSLKTEYRATVDMLALISNADAISKQDFLLSYHKARLVAICRKNCISGFRKTGLWPVDVSVPLANPRLIQSVAEAIASEGKNGSKQSR